MPSSACDWSSDVCSDRKSTRLNSSHDQISYAVFCLKKKKKQTAIHSQRQTTTPTRTQDEITYADSSLRALTTTLTSRPTPLPTRSRPHASRRLATT